MSLRWAFPNPTEAARRAEVEAKIDAFWAALRALVPELNAGIDEARLLDVAHRFLRAIDEQLMWEVRPGNATKWKFVVSCEATRSLQPLVDHVVRRAPPDLGIEVASFREPESVEAALLTVEGRFGADAGRWKADFREPVCGALSVVWHGPGAEDQAAAICLTTSLLGERDVFDWVGPIEVAQPSLLERLFRGGRVPVGEFPMAFAEARRALLELRPDSPLQVHSRGGPEEPWSVASLEPRAGRDGLLPDLITLRTTDLDLMGVKLMGAPFSSRRFSRFDEWFLYVQCEVPADEGVQLNAALEDDLDAALREGALGRTIGAGTGERFSAVMLVVSDLARALPRVRDALVAARAPRNCWIRFFDDTLANEWLGAWPETPAPPN